MDYLQRELEAGYPGKAVEVYGFDLTDSLLQPDGYEAAARAWLENAAPGVDWGERFTLIGSSDSWPYPADFFDVILSNQVLEHVEDLERTFREIRRALRPGGISIHLFPLLEDWYEGHAFMPLVHRIRDMKRRATWIAAFTRIGLRKRYHMTRMLPGCSSVEGFARRYAQVLEDSTHYRTAEEIEALARRADLLPTYDYTKDFILSKIASMFGGFGVRYRHWGHWERLPFGLCKRLSGVTLLLRPNERP